MLPHSLLFNDGISRAALLVFWVLTVHPFRGRSYCFPSLTTLQKETRYSRPTVIKAVKASGYLEVEKAAGRPNKYWLRSKG